MELEPGMAGMELRQLRYFVTLAEELHFGRAAAREHIVQSALSQQLQRLERELGVLLLDRTTHHVELTQAGSAFLIEARQILAHVDRAAVAAQRAASSAPSLRVGVVDASYDSMPQILREVQQRYPELEIHQVEAGVPEQFRLLVDGRLDVGLGRASLAPPEVASELFRLDPLGVLVPQGHRFAALAGGTGGHAGRRAAAAGRGAAGSGVQPVRDRAVPVGRASSRPCIAGPWRASERRSTWSRRGAVCCVSRPPVWSAVPGIVWRPLVAPVSRYPWSVLWRAGDPSEHVRALVACARTLSQELGWLRGAEPGDGVTAAPAAHQLR